MEREDQVARRLRLKDLHTLRTVAEAGSMAKASGLLALSQPAISKAIADMEFVLGVPLFDRSSSGVELTDAGRVLLDRSRTILDEVRQGVTELQELSDPTRGLIRIGTTEPIAGVLAEILVRMSAKYPRMRHEILVTDTDTLNRDLRERKLDLLLTRWVPPLVADDLSAEVLFNSPLVVMAHKRHPLMRRSGLKLADLADEQWTLSPADSFLGRIVVELFRKQGLALPAAAITSVSIYMRLNLLASGRFISVLPVTMMQHATNQSWLRPVEVDIGGGISPIASIMLRKRLASGAVRLFREVAKTVCAEFDEPCY